MDYFEKRILLDDTNELVKIYDVLEPRLYDIIYHRYGFDNIIMTLEEIGNKHDLSRERIRQLEKEAIKSLKWYLGRNDSKLKLYRIFDLVSNEIGLPYIAIDVLYEYLSDMTKTFKIALLFEVANSSIKYSSKHRLIYDERKISLDDINKKILEALKYLYDVEEYNGLPLVAQALVGKEYIFDGSFYKKRNFDKEKEVSKIVRKLFPYGFKPSNKEQLDVLNSELMNSGIRKEVYNTRELFALLDRESFCLIDRGTYIYNDDAIELPEDVLKEIHNSILWSKDNKIYYKDLYEQYETVLKEYGVNNYYYLKGIIDKDLNINYSKSKDYIIKDSCYKHIEIIKPKKESKDLYWDNYVNNMKKALEKFNLEEINDKNEQNSNVDLDNYKMDYVTRCALEKFIKYAFKKSGSNTLKLESLYIIFETDYKTLQEELPFIDSPIKLKRIIEDNSYLCNFYNDLVKLKL